MIRVGFIPGRSVASGSMNLAADTIWSCRELLKDLGVDLRLDVEANVDVIWSHWRYLTGERSHLLTGDLPVIVDEERDSEQVSPVLRKEANRNSRIVGIVKPFLFRNRENYSAMQWNTGLHHEQFQPIRPDLYPKERKTPGEDFDTSLLHVSTSYGTYRRLRPLKATGVDFTAKRPIAVHFRGWVHYSKSKSDPPVDKRPPSAHRMLCVEAIRNLRGLKTIVSDSRAVSLPQYWNELSGSAVCVSPWGWAPSCHRDYEAILSGCLLVKPPSDHITALPDIYDPLPWYVPCKPDFSDLEVIVKAELEQWDANAALRSRLRQRLIDESSPEVVATHIAKVIRSCLERAK